MRVSAVTCVRFGAVPANQELVLRPFTKVAWDVLPFACAVTVPSNLPRTMLPEYLAKTWYLTDGILDPVSNDCLAVCQVSVPYPVAYPFSSRLPDQVAASPGWGSLFQTRVLRSLVR